MGLEKFNIKVSTWIRTQPVAPPVRLSELMTRPLLSVPPPPVRRRRHPPFGAMARLLIIGTILSLCHISPAGAFSPLHPLRLPLRLKSFQLHVPLQTKTLRQNKPAALDSFHTYSTTTIGLLYSKYPPLQSRPQPRVVLSHCRLLAPHLTLHTLTFTPQKPPESCFKVSRVHATVAGPLYSC